MSPFAECVAGYGRENERRRGRFGARNRGAGRNVVPVFSERLKKFKSNANEGEELNILAGGGGPRVGGKQERGRRMRDSPAAEVGGGGVEGRAGLLRVVGVAALSRRELVQD